MKLGTKDVTALRVGAVNASRAYLGSTLVWEAKAPDPDPVGVTAPLRHGETGWGAPSLATEWEAGWRFTVGPNNLTATHLMLYQAAGASEKVNLYRVSTQTLVATADITSAGGWAESAITPVVLLAGEDYALTRYAGGASRSYDQTPHRDVDGIRRSVLYDPAITVVGGAYSTTGGYPSTSGGSCHSVNMRIAAPGAGYRFYRLHVTAANGGTNVRASRLELRAEIGGGDTTGSSVVWEDSLAHESFSAENLRTASTTTYWITASGVVDASAYYDFGTHNPQTIVQYAVRSANNASQAPSSWTLEASNDLVTWDVLHTVTGETGWSTSETRVFTL